MCVFIQKDTYIDKCIRQIPYMISILAHWHGRILYVYTYIRIHTYVSIHICTHTSQHARLLAAAQCLMFTFTNIYMSDTMLMLI
jgi:hypothetical protein